MQDQKGEIDIKEYIDSQFKAMRDYVDINFALDRKAVDQYSKTNDEWKLLHNGLQRKMEEERGKYVYQERYDQAQKLISDKMSESYSRLDEKINMTKANVDDKRDSLMKNIEDKLFASLNTEVEKHAATDKQMQTLIDANAAISNHGISDLNGWRSTVQGSIKVILAVGSFLMAIVIGLVIAFIKLKI